MCSIARLLQVYDAKNDGFDLRVKMFIHISALVPTTTTTPLTVLFNSLLPNGLLSVHY
jgi:hypothetical protein